MERERPTYWMPFTISVLPKVISVNLINNRLKLEMQVLELMLVFKKKLRP
jgi:hypothetical protein